MDLDILSKIDRIHPYPAKFTVEMAMEMVEKYSKKWDLVYDPFVWSWTTLLAANVLWRNSYWTDINAIAILISEFKVLKLNENQIKDLRFFIQNILWTNIDTIKNVHRFSYPSIEHWFCEDSICFLSFLKESIEQLKDEWEKTFAKLVMSSIVNVASNQESDTRYAAIHKPKLNIEYLLNTFWKKFNTAIEIYCDYRPYQNDDCFAKPILLDSSKCWQIIPPNSVNLILTSPPYPNTYDYYLYHKHRMNWLWYNFKDAMDLEIWSRREFSSLKQPKEKFNNDMLWILSECNKVLMKDWYSILIMWDGKIQWEIYESKSNMVEICSQLNWELVDYKYTLLDNTSRSFQQSFRTTWKKEHILVFKKI